MIELNGSKNARKNHETIKYKRIYWVHSFIFFSSNFPMPTFNSIFLLSPMVILLWHKTILSRFKVFPFMVYPNSWLPCSTLFSPTSIPFFTNRISFQSADAESFVWLVNISFTLAKFICSSTFLCCSRNAPYLSVALSHGLNSSWVTLIFSMPPLSIIKSLTSRSATMVSSLMEYPWMLNKLLLMENPRSGSTFAWSKESIQAARRQRVPKWKNQWVFLEWLMLQQNFRENLWKKILFDWACLKQLQWSLITSWFSSHPH